MRHSDGPRFDSERIHQASHAPGVGQLTVNQPRQRTSSSTPGWRTIWTTCVVSPLLGEPIKTGVPFRVPEARQFIGESDRLRYLGEEVSGL